MPDVQVNYKVHMTQDHQLNGTIGTDGLATCVGVIARLVNGNTYCAHISCEMSGIAANLPIIATRTSAIMPLRIAVANVVSMHCATSNLIEPTSMAIYNGLVNTYGATVQPMQQGNGIYFDGNNVVVTAFGTNIIGTLDGPQEDNGPINVQN
ncbi:hypothetical protein RB653_003661 [Dictyostelium firmibasis]|uniref:Uncharacterized protein n=1 Tax=Dictyostelium firmibasis TaxID=79012 RepID=A0AAN7UHV3_9MYCE